MIRIKLVNRESGALRRRLQEIARDLDPASRKMDRFRGEVKQIRVQDNIDMLTHRGGGTYSGEDRFGRDIAPPAASTLKGRKGVLAGFVLAPRGLASRTITNFFVKWERVGDAWRMVDGWRDIPWMIYHLRGAPAGSKPNQPNWSLPMRDVGGWSLKGLAQARAAFRRLADSIRKGSG